MPSIRIATAFHVNADDAIEPYHLLENILKHTVGGEKLEYIERPITEMHLFFKKKRYSMITLITDYQDDEEDNDNLLGQELDSLFFSSLQELLFKIKSEMSIVDAEINFDLANRQKLSVQSCIITPKDKLYLEKAFTHNSTYDIIKALNMSLNVINTMQLKTISLITDNSQSYRAKFSFVKSKLCNNNSFDISNPINITTRWANIFDNIVHLYSIPHLNLKLTQHIDVLVESLGTDNHITFKSYYLESQRGLNNTINSFKALNSLINSKTKAKISCIMFTKTPNVIGNIKVYIEPNTYIEPSESLSLSFESLNANKSEVSYCFKLIDHKYYLLECTYRKQETK